MSRDVYKNRQVTSYTHLFTLHSVYIARTQPEFCPCYQNHVDG